MKHTLCWISEKGEVTIDYRDESNTPDMVVRRSDGSYVFHFVNVVDDLEMQITHVIRAEEHRVLLGFWRGKRLTAFEPRIRPSGKYELGNIVFVEGDRIVMEKAPVDPVSELEGLFEGAYGDDSDRYLREERGSWEE